MLPYNYGVYECALALSRPQFVVCLPHILAAKQSFYWYALFLAVLNLTQAAGSGLYYYDIREGVW